MDSVMRKEYASSSLTRHPSNVSHVMRTPELCKILVVVRNRGDLEVLFRGRQQISKAVHAMLVRSIQ